MHDLAFHFQGRSLSFSVFSLTMRHVLTGLRKLDGMTGSPARIAALWASLSGLRTVPLFCVVAPAAKTRA